MKTRGSTILAAVVLGVMLAPAARCESSALDSLKTWFQHWKEGLAGSAVEGQYQQKSLTNVAAVRGKNQKADDPNQPYIKGTLDQAQEKKLRKERAELGQAVDLILSGKFDEGGKKLDAFEEKHQNSPLLRDVHQAREKLKELKAGSSERPAQ